MVTGEPPAGELKEAALSGVRWTTLARGVAEFIGLVSMVALARMVPPADFGRFAVVLIVIGVAAAVSGQGCASALVQRKELREDDPGTAVTLSVLAALALALLTFFVGPILGGLIDERTGDLTRLAAPVFLIMGASAVPVAMLQRDLDFRSLGLYEVGGLVSGAVAATGLALAGLDGEALVLGQLAGALVNAILVIRAAPFIRLRWSRDAASGILRFGAPAAGSSLMTTAFRNVDYAILAVVLSPTAVGYYFRAYRLGVEYQLKLTRIVQRVAFPIYSRAGTLERRREIRQRIVRVQAVICVPALGIFIVIAPDLVPWLFGPTWEPAVVPAQILAVAGMIGTMLAGIGPLVLGAGRPGALLIYNIFYTVTYAGIVLVTAPYGLKTVCFGVIGAQLLNLVAAHWYLLKRIAGIPMRSTIEDAAPALVPTVAIIALCMPLEGWLSGTSLPTIVTLTAVTIVALGVGTVALRLFARSTWQDVMLVVRRVVGRKRPAGAGRGRHTAPVEA